MHRSDLAEGFKQLAATTRSPSQLEMIDQYLADVPADLGQKILILLHYSEAPQNPKQDLQYAAQLTLDVWLWQNKTLARKRRD